MMKKAETGENDSFALSGRFIHESSGPVAFQCCNADGTVGSSTGRRLYFLDCAGAGGCLLSINICFFT